MPATGASGALEASGDTPGGMATAWAPDSASAWATASCGRGYPYYPSPYAFSGYGGPPPYGPGPACAAPVPLSAGDVLIGIRVPADAAVWINGTRTGQSGPRREFLSSGLAPGRSYTFDISACWAGPAGKLVESEKRLTVRGGERRTVDLTAGSIRRSASASPAAGVR